MNKLFASSLEYYLHDLIKQVDGQCDYGVDDDNVKKLLLKISKRLNILYESDYSWAVGKAKSDEIDGALSRLCGQIYGWDGGGWSVNKLTGIEKALRLPHRHTKSASATTSRHSQGEGQLTAVPYDPDKNRCSPYSICYTCTNFLNFCPYEGGKRGKADECKWYHDGDAPEHSSWD